MNVRSRKQGKVSCLKLTGHWDETGNQRKHWREKGQQEHWWVQATPSPSLWGCSLPATSALDKEENKCPCCSLPQSPAEGRECVPRAIQSAFLTLGDTTIPNPGTRLCFRGFIKGQSCVSFVIIIREIQLVVRWLMPLIIWNCCDEILFPLE